MWKYSGAIRFFLSILAVTFVQMGVFIYAQKILSGSFAGVEGGQNWQSLMLQIFFIAPYVVFVWAAGLFSNKFSKNKVLAWSSLFMTSFVIAMAVLVTCGVPRVAFWLCIGLSTGFAVHSAAKYAVLKEMFGVRNLSYANAFLQIFSLSGIIAASWLAIVGVNLIDLGSLARYEAVRQIIAKSVVIPWILVGVSVLGTVASFLIPKVKYADRNVKFTTARRRFSLGWRQRSLRATIIALSMFWAMAQVFTLMFQDVSGSETVDMIQNYLPFAIGGLMVGSIFSARNSRDFIETGFIPLGMIGTSLCMFLIPFMVVFVVFQLIPLVTTIYNSFFENYMSGLKQVGPNFIGLKNYVQLLTQGDLLKYFKNTMIMWIAGFIPQILLSLLLGAWFTNPSLKLKGQRFFKTVIYLPNLIMASAFSMLFFTLFANTGPVNSILVNIGIFKEPYQFMSHAGTVRGLVAMMNRMMWFGNTKILLMAGMMGISDSLYEAAEVDGATGLRCLC